MVLFPLLKNITLRHLRHHKGRTLLSMIGIAMGVGVFVSVQLAIHTAIESFNASVDHVSGKANLQITSFGRGFSEVVYLKVKKVPGIKAATPVLQYTSKINEPIGEPLYLLGSDVFSDRPFREYQFYASEDEGLLFLKDPHSIAITEKLANRPSPTIRRSGLTRMGTGPVRTPMPLQPPLQRLRRHRSWPRR